MEFEEGSDGGSDGGESLARMRSLMDGDLEELKGGLLSLYEASYIEKEGEAVLKEAMDFATEQLKEFMEEGSIPEAGDLRDQDADKSELKELSRWWSGLGLSEKLPFSRNRLTEGYLWTVVIDDIYDVYGTLDELQLFTDVVDRWDLTAMDKLPKYMKLCFFALFNMVHEEGYWVMKEKGLDIVPGLKKEWGNSAKHTLRKQNGSTMDKLPSSKSTWRMVLYGADFDTGGFSVVAFSKSDPLRRGKVAEEIPDKRGCFLTFDALFNHVEGKCICDVEMNIMLESSLNAKEKIISELNMELHNMESTLLKGREQHLNEIKKLNALINEKDSALLEIRRELQERPTTRLVDDLRKKVKILQVEFEGLGELRSKDEEDEGI
ncbi:hypothetical protein ZIOFF_001172 [Zingiber officinale]|uniref:Terpene synthase metal-binding domain-containing protein n=1 Tax=Zingiber officinale TaxID=94328 RepID=A0A8J5I5J9_ZINOF|nr:hypothetical protein ZIOFF_001172 [Zingiber officinale]